MKGSDNVKMTINIGGELILLNVDFNDQNEVRDTEREIKSLVEHLKKSWPENSDRNILAMATYQFAKWCSQLKKEQLELLELTKLKCSEIDLKLLTVPEED